MTEADSQPSGDLAASDSPRPEVLPLQGEGERDARKCEHQREDGTLCNGWKVRGEAYCAGHLGLGVASDPKGYGAIGAAQSGENRSTRAEQARKTPAQVYRETLLANAERLAARLLDIAENGSDADALRAIEALTNRVLGRPTERVEVDTPPMPTSLEEVRSLTREQRQALLAELGPNVIPLARRLPDEGEALDQAAQ